MNVRSLLLVGAMALSSAALASAKTYDITLVGPTKAGAVELQAGEYKVRVEGSQAVFTDAHNKSFTVPATVENAEKKFGDTRLETVNHDGIDTIQAIDLGDSVNTRGNAGAVDFRTPGSYCIPARSAIIDPASAFSREATVPLSNSARCLIGGGSSHRPGESGQIPDRHFLSGSGVECEGRVGFGDGFQQLERGVDSTSDFGHSPSYLKFVAFHIVRLSSCKRASGLPLLDWFLIVDLPCENPR